MSLIPTEGVSKSSKLKLVCFDSNYSIYLELEAFIFIIHEEFDKETYNNDIALLELEEEVDLSVYTPVCLPSSVRNRDNTPALAIGKGRVHLILFIIWNCAKLNPPVYAISTRTFPKK